jgi:hypothetical protein
MSSRFPKNPLGALTPIPVPAISQLLEVVPAGSIKNCGFVVVLVPPVNHVPDSVYGGALAAALAECVHLVARVMLPLLS